MENLLQKLRVLFSSPTHSRTLAVLALLIIVSAIPLTVFIAQKQQEIRQRASQIYDEREGQGCGYAQNCDPGNGDVGNGQQYCDGIYDRWGQCTNISCNACSYINEPSCIEGGSFCTPSSNPCKGDGVCLASGNCNYPDLPDGAACPGGTCQGGSCTGNTACGDGGTYCPARVCYQEGVCLQGGQLPRCNYNAEPDGTSCPGGTCQGGSCVSSCEPCSGAGEICSNLPPYTSSCDDTTLCTGTKSCGGSLTCSGGHQPGEDYPACDGCDEGVYTCGSDGNYTWASVTNPSAVCGAGCVAGDVKISDGCPPQECDSNLKKYVCIETWRRPDGSEYTKPGTLTDESCGDGGGVVITPPGGGGGGGGGNLTLSGQVTNASTGQGIANVVINQGVGAADNGKACYIGTATTGSDGRFSYSVPSGQIFCMRAPAVSGFTLSSGGYECQRAGGLFNPDACNNSTGGSIDVAPDNAYNFAYTPVQTAQSPTPTRVAASTPTVTPTQGVTSTPTVTTSPAPGDKILALELYLKGVGTDIGENQEPKTTTRTVTVELFNASNQKLGDKTGNVTYDATSKTFKGTVNGGNVPAGNYSVKVKAEKYLRKAIAGIIQVTQATTTVTAPKTTLLVGDINGDNKINILDYNQWKSCLNKKVEESCVNTDLNDDGSNDTEANPKLGTQDIMSDFKLLKQSFQTKEGD